MYRRDILTPRLSSWRLQQAFNAITCNSDKSCPVQLKHWNQVTTSVLNITHNITQPWYC